MKGISVSNKILEKYFAFLVGLDAPSKNRLIAKLKESPQAKDENMDLNSLFGAWEDDRSTEEIIQDIRDSRVNGREIEDF
ncbi:MAG: hypothetical protein H6581_03635 [Bacteroidia bacterium]|nr:hypothetical protein [Bacteroidia bacterium]